MSRAANGNKQGLLLYWYVRAISGPRITMLRLVQAMMQMYVLVNGSAGDPAGIYTRKCNI